MTGKRSPALPDALEEGPRSVLEALAAGACSPGELVAVTGRPARTISRYLARLRDSALVEGLQTEPRLTAAGQRVVRPVPPIPATAYDRMVSEILPAPQAAICRLTVDALVFRHHFPEHPRQPGFVIFGPKNTGKTAAAELIAQALGLELRTVLRELSSLSPGALVGRRRQEGGGRWVFDSSEVAELPFVVLDEADKADGELRKEMFRIFGELPRVVIEGTDVLLRAVPLVVFNALPGKGETGLPTGVLHEAQFRRAIVCSTHGLPAREVDQLPDRLRRHYADPVRSGQLVSPADHPPPGERLPDETFGLLVQIREVLTPAGRPFVQLDALEVLTLGRAGRLGCRPGDNLAGVAAGVVTDVLTCWETVPSIVVPGWTLDAKAWRRWLGDSPGVEAFLEAASRAEDHRCAVALERAGRHKAADIEDLELVGKRATLRAVLDEAIVSITRVPKADRPNAAGLRAQLRKLRDDAGAARSNKRLEEISANAAPVLSQTQALVRAIYRTHLEIEQAQRARIEADHEAKVFAAAQQRARAAALAVKKERRRRIRAELGPWRRKWAAARRRTTTRRGEDVVDELLELRVVSPRREFYLERQEPDPVEKWWAHKRHRPEPQLPDVKRVHAFFVDSFGTRYERPALASWGSAGVLRTIDASLEWAARLEELYVETGGTVERSAPELDTGSWDPFAL